MAIRSLLKKAVLLITGSWHVCEHYGALMSQLEDNGIRVICDRLPTNNNASPPNATIHDDTELIKDIVAKEAAAGTQLVALVHSYGGMVGSGALAEFAVARNSTEGGVIDIIFMAAFVPCENQSLAALFGGTLPAALTMLPNGAFKCVDPAYYFYNDLSPVEAKKAIDLLIDHQAPSALLDPIICNKVAWRVISMTYIVCENDTIIPPHLQEKMLNEAKAQGTEVQEYRLPSSHSPFLSMPERVVDIILKVIRKE